MIIATHIVTTVFAQSKTICDFDRLHNDVAKLVTENGHVIIFDIEGEDLTYSVYFGPESDADSLITTGGFPFGSETDAIQKLLEVTDKL